MFLSSVSPISTVQGSHPDPIKGLGSRPRICLGHATVCVHQVALVHQRQGGGDFAHMQLVDATSSYLFRQSVAHSFNEALNYAIPPKRRDLAVVQ
jgi:hypothetical protein